MEGSNQITLEGSGKTISFRKVAWRQFMRSAEGNAEEYCALARHLSDTEIEVTVSTVFPEETQFSAVALIVMDLQRMHANGRDFLAAQGMKFTDDGPLGLPLVDVTHPV